MKSVIKTIVETGKNTWKDKELTKHFVQFETGENGTLTTGFTEDLPPVVGDEIEFTIEDNGFGSEVKLPRKPGKGGGFGGKTWSPEQVAQQDAVKVTCSYIESGNDLKFWKAFFIEAKEFMLQQTKPVPTIGEKVLIDNGTAPGVNPNEAKIPEDITAEPLEVKSDKLPF